MKKAIADMSLAGKHTIFKGDKYRLFLVVIVGLNLILRFGYVTTYLDNDRLYWPDEKKYLQGAQEISSLEKPIQFFTTPTKYKREPLYAFFLAVLKNIFPGNSITAIRCIQSLLFVLGSWFIYDVVKLITGHRGAIIALICYLFYPYYVYLPGTILPESLYTLLLVILIWLLVHLFETEKASLFPVSSIILAIAFLTKATALSLLPVIVLAGYYTFKKQPFVRQLALAIAGFILICVPIWCRNQQLGHRYPWLTRNDLAYMPENPAWSDATQPMIKRVSSSAGRLGKNMVNYFSILPGDIQSGGEKVTGIIRLVSIFSVLPLFVALISGLFVLRWKETGLLYLMYLFYALPYLLIFGDTRYRLPVDFIGIIIFSMLTKDFLLYLKPVFRLGRD